MLALWITSRTRRRLCPTRDNPGLSRNFVINELNPIPTRARLTYMGGEQDKLAIEAKLARCREAQRESDCEFTAAHLRELVAELQSQLRRLDQRRPGPWGREDPTPSEQDKKAFR